MLRLFLRIIGFGLLGIAIWFVVKFFWLLILLPLIALLF